MQNPVNNRYYIQDALGHTRALLDNQGHITDTYVYDAWGNLLKGSEWDSPNPFTWNGAYGYQWIDFTGLYHVGAREYDPRVGRWLQRDPIGVAGGDPNLYRYCRSNPLNSSDPEGLDERYAKKTVCKYKYQIIRLAKLVGIQPELLAGVVYNETYGGRAGEIISNWHEYNAAASVLKFIHGEKASLGITQYSLDPKKLPGCDTKEGRERFVMNYITNPYMQLTLTAAMLKELAERPNRYPGRAQKLTASEMAIILTEYNRGGTFSPASKAKPSAYGQHFMRSLKTIRDLLFGSGCDKLNKGSSCVDSRYVGIGI